MTLLRKRSNYWSWETALGRRCALCSAVACTLVLLLALCAGLIRILPWLFAEDVPIDVIVPFAKALLSVSIETALLVGLPTGFAVGAASFVERGEALALLSLGASPLRLLTRVLPLLVLLGGIAFVSGIAWDPATDEPGRFARALIEQGRESCSTANKPRSVQVPMVNLTWLCFPGRTPRIAGALPRSNGAAWFSAKTLRPSADLRRFDATDFELLSRKVRGRPEVRVRVLRAEISGLPSWGRPATLSMRLRSLLLAVTSTGLSGLVAFGVLRVSLANRFWATALGLAGAVASLHTLHTLDGSGLPALAYAGVPVLGALAAALVLAAAVLSRRLRRSHAGRAP